jgi:hypothetical protein
MTATTSTAGLSDAEIYDTLGYADSGWLRARAARLVRAYIRRYGDVRRDSTDLDNWHALVAMVREILAGPRTDYVLLMLATNLAHYLVEDAALARSDSPPSHDKMIEFALAEAFTVFATDSEDVDGYWYERDMHA